MLTIDCLCAGYHKYGIRIEGHDLHFKREPDNPHDANAISVYDEYDSIVGHVDRETAARLAPLMDEFSYEIILEGTGEGLFRRWFQEMEIAVWIFRTPTRRSHEIQREFLREFGNEDENEDEDDNERMDVQISL